MLEMIIVETKVYCVLLSCFIGVSFIKKSHHFIAKSIRKSICTNSSKVWFNLIKSSLSPLKSSRECHYAPSSFSHCKYIWLPLPSEDWVCLMMADSGKSSLSWFRPLPADASSECEEASLAPATAVITTITRSRNRDTAFYRKPHSHWLWQECDTINNKPFFPFSATLLKND